MDKSRIAKIAAFAGVGLIALVMLIMHSLMVDFMAEDFQIAIQDSIGKRFFATFLFTLFGIIVLIIAFVLFYKNDKAFDKVSLGLLLGSLLLFVIAFSISGSLYEKSWNEYKKIADFKALGVQIDLPSNMEAVYRTFPVDLTFTIVGGLATIGGAFVAAKEDMVF